MAYDYTQHSYPSKIAVSFDCCYNASVLQSLRNSLIMRWSKQSYISKKSQSQNLIVNYLFIEEITQSHILQGKFKYKYLLYMTFTNLRYCSKGTCT